MKFSQGRLCAGAWMLSIAGAVTHTANAEQLSTAAVTNTLTIPSGQSFVIHYPAVKRIAAGDGNIIDVKVFDDTGEVLVLARKEGITDLRIWGRDGTTETRQVRVLRPAATSPPSLLPQQTILIKARLIEVKKSALRDIGIDWADVAAGPAFTARDEFITDAYRVASAGLPAIDSMPLNLGKSNRSLTLTTTLDSFVNLLVNNGNARTLAEPTLSCIDGGSADFLVGGEVPIPVQNQDGALNVVFKQFGIILNVEPHAGEAGLIRTKVNVEVSSVDKGIQVLGIPGFATRKTSTEMNVLAGETMVVAGLLTSEDAKAVVKVPGLGHIPILGELFKSRQFRRGESELVVLVTPYIIRPDSEAVKAGVRRYDELREESDKALQPALRD